MSHRVIDCKLNESIVDSDRSNVKTGVLHVATYQGSVLAVTRMSAMIPP